MKAFVVLLCLFSAACVVRARSAPASEADEIVEVAAAGEDAEVLVLRFAAADELAETLNALELSHPPTRVLADARTNALIVQGPQVGRTRVRELVTQLDVESPRR